MINAGRAPTLPKGMADEFCFSSSSSKKHEDKNEDENENENENENEDEGLNEQPGNLRFRQGIGSA